MGLGGVRMTRRRFLKAAAALGAATLAPGALIEPPIEVETHNVGLEGSRLLTITGKTWFQ